jgi:hypothetical protein
LTSKWIKRGTHRCVPELGRSIRTWITNRNDDPKPFVWHKTADEILDSLAAYCQRINDSGVLERNTQLRNRGRPVTRRGPTISQLGRVVPTWSWSQHRTQRTQVAQVSLTPIPQRMEICQ